MPGLLKVAHGIDRISEVCGRISVYLTVAVIAVGFYNVFVRYTGRFVGVQLSSNLWIETQKRRSLIDHLMVNKAACATFSAGRVTTLRLDLVTDYYATISDHRPVMVQVPVFQ